MAKVHGREQVAAYFASLREDGKKVLLGAGRAGGKVIAEDAKRRANSDEVRDAIVVRSRSADGRIVVKITVKDGWALALGTWAEYGTDAHFISVDDSQRGGRSVNRINRQVREEGGNASLVIGGQFVGKTVFHPGARPEPFLRPALDQNEAEAVAAAQSYINARVGPGGFRLTLEKDDEE